MNNKFIFLISILVAVMILIYNNTILELVSLMRFSSLTVFMKVITSFIFIFLLFLVYSFLLKEKKNIILLWITVVISYLINFILKNIFRLQRPVGIITESGYSFPSTHAAVMFASFAVMSFRFKYKWIFFLIAILITFSRLYLGVHYLGDLIVGGLIGYFIGVYISKKWK